VEWRDEREVSKKLSDVEYEADLIVTELTSFCLCLRFGKSY
jgi:hypothetical protein